MFEAGQRVKVLVDKAFSSETGMRGREGAVLDNASSSDVVTYVKLDGANTDERTVFGKRMACEVFSNNQLKVVEAKGEENMQKFDVGDLVEVIQEGLGGPEQGTQTHIIYGPDGGGCYGVPWERGHDGSGKFPKGLKGFWIDADGLKLIKPAKAKSQKISIEEVQVGDEIVTFASRFGVEVRRKGVVARITPNGRVITSEGANLGHNFDEFGQLADVEHVYLLNRPEPKKPEIEDGVYWVRRNEAKSSNTIYRVEVATGRAGFFLPNGERTSGDYGLLVRTKNGLVSHLDFHTEDPTPKGFDALDKTKMYFLKDNRGSNYPLDWYLAFKDGIWKYGNKDEISTTAGGFEKYFTEGTDAWEKPVEWVEPELTDLEKFERAGYVGKKFDGGPIYKVTRKGNVKYKAPSGVWENSFHSADTFFEDIKDGLVVGI